MLDVYNTIKPFAVKFKSGRTLKFDVIPADAIIGLFKDQDGFAKIDKYFSRLRDTINTFRNEYDYIFIDCPTNWMFFTQISLYACHAVLIPTKHKN